MHAPHSELRLSYQCYGAESNDGIVIVSEKTKRVVSARIREMLKVRHGEVYLQRDVLKSNAIIVNLEQSFKNKIGRASCRERV